MTPEEIAEFWRYFIEYRNPPQGQRRGQAMFNALHTVAPELANMVRGTDKDPFYRDDRIDAFRAELGV